jgi:hypothetical protein
MRKLFLLILPFLLFVLVFPVSAQQGVTYYVNVRAAKVRLEAKSTAKLVTTLGRGKSVVVLDVVTGEKVSGVDKWYKVSISGKEGYILSSLLTDRAPVVVSHTASNGNSAAGSSGGNTQTVTATPAPAPAATSAPVVSPGNGATALCNDGTYSYAAHHQGACSHHHGVSVFYK